MANTKSAKKATRVAARRTAVNKNRVSRIRTHVRKVEATSPRPRPLSALPSPS